MRPYTRFTMSETVELPEALLTRLRAEAERRGTTVEHLAADILGQRYHRRSSDGDGIGALDAFIGCFDSGDPDWASTDTHVLRSEANATSRTD